jgi:hypothetical protein
MQANAPAFIGREGIRRGGKARQLQLEFLG